MANFAELLAKSKAKQQKFEKKKSTSVDRLLHGTGLTKKMATAAESH